MKSEDRRYDVGINISGEWKGLQAAATDFE